MVNIHIDRLVLDGLFVPYQRQMQLQEAVAMELERLFTSDGLPNGWQSGGATSHTSGSEIQLANNAENDTPNLGQQIARAVFKGVSR